MRLSLNVNRNLDRDETLLQIFMMELSQPAQARGTGGEQHARVRTDEKRERASWRRKSVQAARSDCTNCVQSDRDLPRCRAWERKRTRNHSTAASA